MKTTPFLQEVIYLTSQFLKSLGYDQISQKLDQQYDLPTWLTQGNPLLKKGLIKIVKEYARSNQKILTYLENRSPPKEEKKQKHKRKKSYEQILERKSPRMAQNSWLSKFEKPKQLEQILNSKAIDEKDKSVKIEKQHKKQKAKISSSEYESQNDSFELQPTKKLKTEIKTEQKQIKTQQEKQKKDQIPIKQLKKKEERIIIENEQKLINHQKVIKKNNVYKQSFSRINMQQVVQLSQKLKDNSFYAKQKFGECGDKWGEFGYQQLKDTRGDSFKKTKGKLKNRPFQGTFMDIHAINSIRID